MSPSLLTKRLQELESAGIITRDRRNGRTPEYRLTAAGEELRPVVMALGEWGNRWTDGRLEKADYDPGVLMWDIRRRIRHDELPGPRTVIQFSFPDGPRGKQEFWLIVEKGEADICLADPGFEPDIHAISPVRAFAEVWLGKRSMADAVRTGAIQLHGARTAVRHFDRWFELSIFAGSAA